MGRWRPRAPPGTIPVTLLVLGCLLVGIILGEAVLWTRRQHMASLPFVGSVLTSLPFALVLAGGGYWLPESGVSPDRYRLIAVWSIGGLVFLGSFFVVVGATWFPGAARSQLTMLRWGTAVGAGGGFVMGVLNARSIDREIAAERAAVRAEEARRQQELLEYLNAVLRHEVLNTANVVGGYADLIEGEITDPDVLERVETIQRQTEELTSVITDVRVLLSAAEDGEELTPVALRGVLEETRASITDRYADAVIDLDVPDGVRVPGDDMLHRLFSNLVANAVEHNDSDPPRVSVTVTVDADVVAVAVADNGPGIPEGMRDDLFDPVPDRDSDHGLGLTIVARLVDRYDGDIDVTATGSEGTTITVTLPRVD